MSQLCTSEISYMWNKQINVGWLICSKRAIRLPCALPSFFLCSYFFFMCQQQMHFFPPMWLKRTKYYWLWGLPWLSTTSSPSLCITENSAVSGHWSLQVVSIYSGRLAELFKPPAQKYILAESHHDSVHEIISACGEPCSWHEPCAKKLQSLVFGLYKQKGPEVWGHGWICVYFYCLLYSFIPS